MDNMESCPLPKPFPPSMEPMRQPTYSEETIRNNELAEEIAVLSAQLQSADYRLLVLLREFDEKGGWAQQGCKTCAHWLSWRIGLNAGAAREKIRVARALANLPLVVISESMSKGEISYSKVRAVTRVATPNNEDQLLTIAKKKTAEADVKLDSRGRPIEEEALDLGSNVLIIDPNDAADRLINGITKSKPQETVA